MSRFRSVIAADLAANVGRTGWRKGVAAFVFHPGFATLFLHRLAAHLKRRGWVRLGNFIWRCNVMQSSCHIHIDSLIGEGLYLPHPAGIVIGSGARIGSGCTIYQNVTLGRNAQDAAYPSVGDGVIIFPGAVLVGGITAGSGAVIGANAVVLTDVPAGMKAAGNPARLLAPSPQAARA